MRKVEYWEAYDGTAFNTEDNCRKYEKFCPLGRADQIQFYDEEGEKKSLSLESLLNCDSFIVYNLSAFHYYKEFCKRMEISEPSLPNIPFEGHFHFVFYESKWICLEEINENMKKLLKNNFNKETLN